MVLAKRRSKDSAVTVSVVIVQIFHERENKLRPFTCQKKKKKTIPMEKKCKKAKWLSGEALQRAVKKEKQKAKEKRKGISI